MLLFNWLHPLTQILAQQSVPFSAEVSTEKAKKVEKPFLHTLLYAPPPVLLELVNAIADDVYTWSRLGLLGKGIGERAGRFSDWCWLIATLVGLVENGVERQMIGSLQTEGIYILLVILTVILTMYFSGRPSVQRVYDWCHGQIKAENNEAGRKGVIEAQNSGPLASSYPSEACYGLDLRLCVHVDSDINQTSEY